MASRSVNMVRHSRGSHIVIPIAVSGVATPENKVTHWTLSFISKKIGTRCRKVRLPSRSWTDAVHPSCDSPNTSRRVRLVQAMPAWLVKTGRAPSRHSRHARVYGPTTTAMHNLSTPPLPLLCRASARKIAAGCVTICLNVLYSGPLGYWLKRNLSQYNTVPPTPRCVSGS